MFFYKICGLCVASEVPLPGVGNEVRQAAPDITIRQAAVPKTLPGAEATGPTWQMAKGEMLLTIPTVARFLLVGGNRITFVPLNEAALVDIPIFLLGTVFGMLLHQRGNIVLHASAVNVNGRAVLFCGASGAGKSTLAAALSRRGYPLVTDDVCALAVGRTLMVYPDGRQLKLWNHAIERLEITEGLGMPVRSSLQKFYVAPSSVHPDPLPLGAIYCLREARPPFTSGIEKPNIVDAAWLLRHNAYRPLLVRRMNQGESYFHAAAAIANHAGIYYLTRKLDFAEMPEVISRLESHWEKIAENAA